LFAKANANAEKIQKLLELFYQSHCSVLATRFQLSSDIWAVLSGGIQVFCSYLTVQSSYPRRYPTGCTSLPREDTLALARLAMEAGHLRHWGLTCPSGGKSLPLKSRHLLVPAAEQLISSSDDNNRNAALWADHPLKAQWLENSTRLRTFNPDISTHSLGMAQLRTAWVWLTASALVSDVSASAYTNGVWLLLRPVSVAHKNRTKRRPRCPSLSNPSTSHGTHSLTVLNDETIEWLLNTCPEI